MEIICVQIYIEKCSTNCPPVKADFQIAVVLINAKCGECSICTNAFGKVAMKDIQLADTFKG